MRGGRQTEDGQEQWGYVNDELFTIREACSACGLSRSMLIKLEQAGFITPHQVDPKTGYRHYDMFDISRLQQYQTLRLMGLSTSEIIDYYSGNEDQCEQVLASMKARLLALTRSVEEVSIRLKKKEAYSFTLLDMPELTCYCKDALCEKPTDMERVSFDAHSETVRRGWRTMPGESIFSIRTGADPLSVPYNATVCIPLDPESLGAGPHDGVRRIAGGTMLSVLYYGPYRDPTIFTDVIRRLLDEVGRRGLTQTGPVRGIGIVAPYTGREFGEEDFVFRFAVPV